MSKNKTVVVMNLKLEIALDTVDDVSEALEHFKEVIESARGYAAVSGNIFVPESVVEIV